MSKHVRDAYCAYGSSDESDSDAGYDSEAAEVSKVDRASKRRKLAREDVSESEEEEDEARHHAPRKQASKRSNVRTSQAFEQSTLEAEAEEEEDDEDEDEDKVGAEDADTTTAPEEPHADPNRDLSPNASKHKKKKKKESKPSRPGVIYLSSLPPYLRPSALRNLLSQRGFAPITRLFLAPASKSKSPSRNARQLYTEGWIEFASHKTARRCAEALNANPVGGRKGGWYHDDVWNMKYLRGMGWEELMAGVRGEKREEEARRDEERRVIARETRAFVEGVEEGKRRKGIEETRRKRAGKAVEGDGDGDDAVAAGVKRTWRQFEVKGKERQKTAKEGISDEARQVLGKIF